MWALYIIAAVIVGGIFVAVFLADKKRRDNMVKRKDISTPSDEPPFKDQ